jgi:hypothetical protein
MEEAMSITAIAFVLIILLLGFDSTSRPTSDAIGATQNFSRSHDAVIRVHDATGNVIEAHKHAGRISRRGEVLTYSVLIAELCLTSSCAFFYGLSDFDVWGLLGFPSDKLWTGSNLPHRF